MASLKQSVSDHARDHLAATGNTSWLEKLTVRHPSRTVFRFWQPGGGYDCNIWKEKTLLDVIEYVHANPVRRGLVKHPEDWEWSSARFWAGHGNVPIRMDPMDGTAL